MRDADLAAAGIDANIALELLHLVEEHFAEFHLGAVLAHQILVALLVLLGHLVEQARHLVKVVGLQAGD